MQEPSKESAAWQKDPSCNSFLMSSLIRHLVVSSVLLAYGLVTIGAEALHSFAHGCASPDSDSAEVGQCHSHSHSGEHHSHDTSKHSQRDSHHRIPAGHDEDSCLICQHLALAQSESPTAKVVSLSAPWLEIPLVAPDLIARRLLGIHESRGPPSAA